MLLLSSTGIPPRPHMPCGGGGGAVIHHLNNGERVSSVDTRLQFSFGWEEMASPGEKE